MVIKFTYLNIGLSLSFLCNLGAIHVDCDQSLFGIMERAILNAGAASGERRAACDELRSHEPRATREDPIARSIIPKKNNDCSQSTIRAFLSEVFVWCSTCGETPRRQHQVKKKTLLK